MPIQSIEIRQRKIFWIFVYAFFLALHYAVVSYSASTFLAGIVQEKNIWVLYTVGAALALVFNLSAASVLRRVNMNKLFTAVSLLTIFNCYLLLVATSTLSIGLHFIFFYSISALLFTFASIILEEHSTESTTGGIRGKYNAIMSGGYLLAPFLASIFINNFGLKSIFALSTFFGVCALFVFYFYIRLVPRIILKKNNLRHGIKKLFTNIDIRNITFGQFGLTTFFTLIVIYFPFKMESVGIPLTQYLSIMLPVALSPFLFMPPLLGYLEDKMRDEKEVLLISYIGLILILIVIAFCESSSIFVWTVLLFTSRLCASSVEISTNSYFYKKIRPEDVGLISIFLSVDYFATILFTGLFSFLVYFADIKTLFLSVSFFLTFVLVYLSKIHDTKNYEKHQQIKDQWQNIWKKSKEKSKRRATI